jgi:predicted porin
MKKRVYCIGLLILYLPSFANAQSSVTLYGRLDEAVEMLHFSGVAGSPAKNAFELANDTSYIGFTGSEDLGGDYRAYFKMESGFNLGNGTLASPTQFFNRESYVAIGTPYGSVQFGSQHSPALWISTLADPFARASSGAFFNLMQSNVGNKTRGFVDVVNNAIQYVSPTYEGLKVRAMYGMGDDPGVPEEVNQMKALGFDYSAHRFYLAFAWQDQVVSGTPAGVAWQHTTYTAGTSYDFSFTKLYAYYLHDTETTQEANTGYVFGFTVPVGFGTIRASYAARFQSGSDSRSQVAALGYTYDLSKTTTLYSTVAKVFNGSEADAGLWPSYKTVGQPANGQDMLSFEVGIRCFF